MLRHGDTSAQNCLFENGDVRRTRRLGDRAFERGTGLRHPECRRRVDRSRCRSGSMVRGTSRRLLPGGMEGLRLLRRGSSGCTRRATLGHRCEPMPTTSASRSRSSHGGSPAELASPSSYATGPGGGRPDVGVRMRALIVGSEAARGSLAAARALTNSGWIVGFGSPRRGTRRRLAARMHRVPMPCPAARRQSVHQVGERQRSWREVTKSSSAEAMRRSSLSRRCASPCARSSPMRVTTAVLRALDKSRLMEAGHLGRRSRSSLGRLERRRVARARPIP